MKKFQKSIHEELLEWSDEFCTKSIDDDLIKISEHRHEYGELVKAIYNYADLNESGYPYHENYAIICNKIRASIKRNFQGEGDIRIMDSVMKNLYYSRTFKRLNGKVHYITNTLVNALMHTNVSIPVKYFKAPFPLMYMVFEGGFRVKPYDKEYNVGGAYVQFNEFNDRKLCKELIIIVHSGVVDDISDSYDGCVYNKALSNKTSVNYSLVIQLSDDMKIKNTMDLCNILNNNRDETSSDPNPESFKTHLLVMNILLYLTSINVDTMNFFPKLKKKPIKSVGKKKRFKKVPVNPNGSSIPYIITGSKLRSPSRRGKNGITIDHKFDVKGHWRWQWYGCVGTEERRQQQIWIMPFTKGHTLCDKSDKPYLAK